MTQQDLFKQAKSKPVGLRKRKRERRELVKPMKFKKRKNNHDELLKLKPLLSKYQDQYKCEYCGKHKPRWEITVDDGFIVKLICETCYKFHCQIK